MENIEEENGFERIVKAQKYLILDGGFSTQCETEGANINDDLWSAKLLYENPDLVERVHLKFYEAGADVAITSTYQASFEGFAAKGFSEEQSIELFHKSINLAKSARDKFWDEY